MRRSDHDRTPAQRRGSRYRRRSLLSKTSIPAFAAPCAIAVLVAGSVAACGSNGRTALAIDSATWRGSSSLLVTTECSTEVEVETGVDHGGSGLPEVTVWGRPSAGRCKPEVTVTVPEGTTRIVDGTTSLVIDLPPAPAEPATT